VNDAPVKIKFTRPRSIELIALCALTPQRSLPRSAICAHLWPDMRDDDARANLRRLLSDVTAALSAYGEILTTDRATIQWNPNASVTVDVIEFDRLARDASGFERAVELYRGDLLEALYEDWLLAPRDRLRASAVQMSHSLGNDALRARDFPRAVALARRALDLSEWREDNLRLLMTALYAMGNRAEALAEFDRFNETLAREMRVEAMHETIALREAILADVPIPQTLPSPAFAAHDEEHALAGRQAEFSALQAAWDRAVRGAGATIFVGGEAGIGKSRIARELVRHVEDRGDRALVSHTSPDATTTYQPLIDVVSAGMSALAAVDLEDVWFASLATVVPELSKLRVTTAEPPALDASKGAERVREGFARALEAMARRRPLLVVLEDLHWADVDTVDAIAHVARRIRGSAILLVLTHRSEETPLSHPLRALRRTLLAEHRASTVSLGALPPEAVAELVTEAVGSGDTAEFATEVARASGGNPLFALQILRHHAEQGSALNESPPEVQALVRARITLLDPDVRSMLNVAALIDERFTVEELAETAGIDEGKVLTSLDPLLDARYVRWSALPGFSLTFSHQLLRDAVVGGMTREGRPALHRRIAQVLERTRSGDATATALIARHFELGGLRDRAYERYLEAARAAAAVYAFRSARDLAHHALSVATDPERRFEALRVAVRADEAIAAASEAYAFDVDAFVQAAEDLDASRRFEALLARCRCSLVALDRVAAAVDVERLLASARASGNKRELRDAYDHSGQLAFMQGNIQDACDAYTQALEYAEEADATQFRIRTTRVSTLLRLGKRDEGLREFEALDRLAKELDDPQLELTVGIVHQTLAITLEETALFQAAGDRLVAVSERIGSVSARAIGMSLLSHAAYQGGDVVTGRALARELSEFIERNNVRLNRIALRLNSAMYEFRLGNIDSAIAAWEAGLVEAERAGQNSAVASCLMNIGEALIRNGEAQRSLDYLRRARDVSLRSGEGRLLDEAQISLAAAELMTGNIASGLANLREKVEARKHSAKLHSADLCMVIEALLAAGLVAEAAPYADELGELYAANRGAPVHPMRVCAALADVAEAQGDAKLAKRYRFAGANLLKAALERIPDEDTRANFARLRFNRGLA